jgi:uncharacterized protein (DUF362 family)
MGSTINRRDFILRSASLGTTIALGGILERLAGPAAYAGTGFPDLAVVEGANYYDATRKAVDALGGMKQFVSKGSRVGLLVNSVFDKPGTYTKPEIALAVITMCYEAGAASITSLEDARGSYWRRATLSKEDRERIGSIKGPGDTVTIDLPHGVKLKSVEIRRDLLACDVYINMPIFKDHEGTRFTGVLKNIMGATSSSSNRFFHKGAIVSGFYDDPTFLSQCIADAHLVRKPTLCIADGTEMIVTNGPSGPGKIVKPHAVVAGTDGVAVDAYGATILGLPVEDVVMIRKAQEHGIGSADLSKLRITKLSV